MAEVEIVEVPSSAGAYGVGLEGAPAAFRQAGLLEELLGRGLEVVDGGQVPGVRFAPDPAGRTAQNLADVVAVAENVASRISRIRKGGRVPLVLGGDCTITLGVVAAFVMAGEDPAVAYMDGDLDLSTPATTRSGVLDAMGVAHMLDLDGVAPVLAAIGDRRPLLEGAQLALIGFEDIDADEQVSLDSKGVHQFPAEDVRADPPHAAREAQTALGASRPLIVHFDVDVIDSIELPLAHYPHFNTGLSLAQATDCLAQLCSQPNVAALVVTEVNPLHDPDGVSLPRLVDALAEALASTGT